MLCSCGCDFFNYFREKKEEILEKTNIYKLLYYRIEKMFETHFWINIVRKYEKIYKICSINNSNLGNI